METKKKKKDILNELLVDPTTYQYVNDDKRNTSNDYEVTSNKTTDQLSAMVDQPEDMYSSNLSYNSFFFYENDDKSIKVEEVLKKAEIKDIVSGNNEQVGDKIIQIINNIKDDFNDQEKYSLIQELIKKLKIKELDKELVNKIIENLKKADNVL